MASLIKTNLPNDFLTNLGAYLQTCAYIELELAIVLTKVEPKREPSLTSQSPTNVTRPNKNEQSLPAFRKLAISRLLKRLKDSAKSLPDDLREELLAVCGYIENNKNHRHLSTHGAFFLDRTSGLLRVNFFPVDGNFQSESESMQIDPTEIETTLDICDQTLRLVIDLRERIDVELARTN